MRTDYFDWVADPGDPGAAPVDRGRETPCGGWENPGDPGENEWKPEASEPNEGAAEARRARSDRLCERLAAAIARETPTGIGHWGGAWGIVEEPSKRALDLLRTWEATGREEDWKEAVAAATAALEAWREAARRWEEEGRPGLPAASAEGRDV